MSTNLAFANPQGEPELMQHLFGMPRMLDALRAHYGTAAAPDASPPAAGEVCFCLFQSLNKALGIRTWLMRAHYRTATSLDVSLPAAGECLCSSQHCALQEPSVFCQQRIMAQRRRHRLRRQQVCRLS